ncbi:MAG: hypothetical protein ABFE08_00985 [Armatimonadia bacterium]
MPMVAVNTVKLDAVCALLQQTAIPEPQESISHDSVWPHSLDLLANSYLAIVGICHQTSPIGERQLEGQVRNRPSRGWDYLKVKFLTRAAADPSWATPEHWRWMVPGALSELYEDETHGKTLGRVNERALLLNDMGSWLVKAKVSHIAELFQACNRTLGGPNGFYQSLSSMAAYSDPVRKKSLFFASIAQSECGWQICDPEALFSPVDYHELRGHLRIGTLKFGKGLQKKIDQGLVLSESEDTSVREAVQMANNQIAQETGISSSALHYFLWNYFRNCCSRTVTCCNTRPSDYLPEPYGGLLAQHETCPLKPACASADVDNKPHEPPYAGHYY